jgi:exopolyphosphatase/guanosine-5'-triphosphate,3'-diphosphate pyrophosphatase
MFAAIDIGTNTVRCIIAKSKKDVLSPLFVDMKIVRLGENFKKTGIINKSAVDRAMKVLAYYSGIIGQYNISPENVIATGTSVMRDALNGKTVADKIYDEFHIKVNIIDGEKEAEITLSGIENCFDGLKNFYAIDIGGGSTEYICCKNGLPMWKKSINIGAIHLTEEFLRSDPPQPNEILNMESYIDNSINILKNDLSASGYSFKEPISLIGTAGTITTLAMVDMQVKDYCRDKMHGYKIKKENIENIYKIFRSVNNAERSNVIGIEQGREDLVISGTAICLKSMNFFNASNIIDSECSLLEGLITYDKKI